MWQDYQPLNYTSHMNQKDRSVSSIVMVEGVKPRRELMFLLSPFDLVCRIVSQMHCCCGMYHLKCIPSYNSKCKLTGDISITRQMNCLFVCFFVIYGNLDNIFNSRQCKCPPPPQRQAFANLGVFCAML